MDLTRELYLEGFRRALRIRRFDERAAELVISGDIPGGTHPTIGQEATVVGSCLALGEDDYMVGTHRSHGHPIGKGADLKPLMAELLGKSGGICSGKGGSMHLADFSVGSLGESSIVGSGLPIAAGAGLSAKVRGTKQVCIGFFGDGGSNEGAFHEALNLSAVWTLPLVWVCENNGYAITTSVKDVVPVENISDRAAAYGMPGITVDGQDLSAVYGAVSEAVRRARNGEGPSMVEAKTYRYQEHAEGLPIPVVYRTEEEIESWRKRDPIDAIVKALQNEHAVSDADVQEIRDEVEREIDEAVAFAKESPFPGPDDRFTDTFAEPLAPAAVGLPA